MFRKERESIKEKNTNWKKGKISRGRKRQGKLKDGIVPPCSEPVSTCSHASHPASLISEPYLRCPSLALHPLIDINQGSSTLRLAGECDGKCLSLYMKGKLSARESVLSSFSAQIRSCQYTIYISMKKHKSQNYGACSFFFTIEASHFTVIFLVPRSSLAHSLTYNMIRSTFVSVILLSFCRF